LEKYNKNYQKHLKESIFTTNKSIYYLYFNIENNPYHLKDWYFLGRAFNFLIFLKTINNPDFNKTKEFSLLKEKADYSFEQAIQLSPNRPELYKEWAKTGLVLKDYSFAREKAQQCIELNPFFKECYWILAISNAYLEQWDLFDYYLFQAKEKGYEVDSKESLVELLVIYKKRKGIEEIDKIASLLIEKYPDLKEKVEDYIK